MIPNLKHGGAEKVLVNLVNNLDPNRYDITVKLLFDVGVHKDKLKPHIRYSYVFKREFRGNNRLLQLFPAQLLWKYTVKEHYDIAVSYLEGPTSRILSGCTDPNIKRAAWVHIEFDSPQKAAVGFRSPKEAETAYNSFDRIVAVSEGVKDSFRKHLFIEKPIHVLYNTNETEQILEKAKHEPDDPRFENDGCFTVCSVGKLMKTKAFERLLYAHERLLKDGIENRVYILGIGEEQKDLERRIREAGVEDSFLLLGFKDNPYQYVARCDLYVCSSWREGFSTAVTEALIVGTPVVSTCCSGASELLGGDNEYGIVTENTAEGIYEGMKRMLSEEGMLQHYRKQAAIRGRFFSREKTAAAVADLFEQL